MEGRSTIFQRSRFRKRRWKHHHMLVLLIHLEEAVVQRKRKLHCTQLKGSKMEMLLPGLDVNSSWVCNWNHLDNLTKNADFLVSLLFWFNGSGCGLSIFTAYPQVHPYVRARDTSRGGVLFQHWTCSVKVPQWASVPGAPSGDHTDTPWASLWLYFAVNMKTKWKTWHQL